MTPMPLRMAVAEQIAVAYAAHRAWPLGTVHEIRVQLLARGPGSLTFRPQVTRRRDLQGPRS